MKVIRWGPPAARANRSMAPREVRMFGIGFQEMLIILVVVLIFFGPKRLPDLAKSLGKGIAEFKKASEEVRKGIEDAVKEGSAEGAPKPPEDLSAFGKAPGAAPAPEEPATPKPASPIDVPSSMKYTPPDAPPPDAPPADPPPAAGAPVPPGDAAPGTATGGMPVPPPRQG